MLILYICVGLYFSLVGLVGLVQSGLTGDGTALVAGVLGIVVAIAAFRAAAKTRAGTRDEPPIS
jgi:hypothetical protein